MIHYVDADESPIPSPGGRTQYKSVETVEGVTVTVQYLESAPLIAVYEGLALDAVHGFHARRHPGLPFCLHDAPWTHHFAPDGSLKYREHTRTVGERAMIVENWSAEGKMMNGTTYLMEDGNIEFAAEFGPDGCVYIGVDSSTGDTVPIEELLPRLAALEEATVSTQCREPYRE